jgi:hypothetical protein
LHKRDVETSGSAAKSTKNGCANLRKIEQQEDVAETQETGRLGDIIMDLTLSAERETTTVTEATPRVATATNVRTRNPSWTDVKNNAINHHEIAWRAAQATFPIAPTVQTAIPTATHNAAHREHTQPTAKDSRVVLSL